MNNHNGGNVRPVGGMLKGSIDMHLRSYRVVTQHGHLAPKPARKFDPAAFYQWLEKQIWQYEQVVIC